MSGAFEKAIALLGRWLAQDVDASEPDDTLDDETNDLLVAYQHGRAARDQAVLDACARLELREHPTGITTCYGGTRDVERLEWARRQAMIEINRVRRELTAAAPMVRAHARAALRRLESNR